MSGPPSELARKELVRATAAAAGAALPLEGEHYYYKNFSAFKEGVEGFRARLQQLLTALPGAPEPPAGTFDDADDAADWVSSLLDAQLEAVDDALAEARRAAEQPASEAAAAEGAAATQAPATKRGRSAGGFTSYMDAAAQLAPRPQERFADPPDNSRTPFVHKLDSLAGVIDVEAVAAEMAAAAAAGAPRPHPLATRLEALSYPAWQLEVGEAVPPKSNEEVPFTYIDSVPALRAAAERLAAAREIAVDLEAHNYRSFQGFCCLMQLSTRSEDIIIDVLALRSHISPALAPIFADPEVVKVLHGSDSDVVWLQRDFGIFIANLFDTGQAARVLDFPGHGLAYLLDFYCGFKADKRFQLADWRARPLNEEMLAYARADTHYLLYCYDKLKAALKEAGDKVPEHLKVDLPPGAEAAKQATGSAALATVLERSRRLCLLQYEKELFTPTSFMELFSKLNATLSDEQLSVFAALYELRDASCRLLDESTGFIMPRAQLLKLAQAMPKTQQELAQTAGRGSQVATRLSAEVLAAVKKALEPESVAAIRQLRTQPWKQALAEHQAQQGQQGQQGQQAQQQAATERSAAAPAAASTRPALQPRTVKPLVAAGASGSLLGAALGGTAGAAGAKPALQPRAIKPLAVGSSMFGAAVQPPVAQPAAQAAPTAPAAPAADKVPANALDAAADTSEEAEEAAVEAAPAAGVEAEPAAAALESSSPVMPAAAAVAKPGLQMKQVKPLAMQQKPAAGGLCGSSTGSGDQLRQPAAPLLGKHAPSSAGSLLGGSSAAAGSAAAAAVRASFTLPFSFAAGSAAQAQAPQAAQQQQQQQQGQQQQAGQEPGQGAAAHGQSQRDAIRSAIEAMRSEQPVVDGEQPQPGNAAGSGDEEQAEEQQQQQEQQEQGQPKKQQSRSSDPVGEFMPLPVSEKYGKGAVKRRAAAEPAAADAGGGASGSAVAKKKAKKGREVERHLKQTMVELGLEDASEAEDSEDEPPARKKRRSSQHQQQQQPGGGKKPGGKQQQQGQQDGQQQQGSKSVSQQQSTPGSAGKAGKKVDYVAAKSKFDLGIVNPHAIQPEEADDRRGRGGRGGRGRGGRGRNGGRSGRGGRGGRGQDDGPRFIAPGKFNPYAMPEVNALKGGKRSAVHVRSGNRSMTFKE